jgi:hypothetical protein
MDFCGGQIERFPHLFESPACIDHVISDVRHSDAPSLNARLAEHNIGGADDLDSLQDSHMYLYTIQY